VWTQTTSGGDSTAPVIQPLTSNTQADIFSTTLNDVVDNIARFWGVPPILANIQVSGKLGNTEELLNSIDLLSSITKPYRKTLENQLNPILERLVGFKEKFKDEKLVIQPVSLVRTLPDFVWTEMDRESRLNFIKDNFDIEIEESDIDESMDKPIIDKKLQEESESEVKSIMNKYIKDE
jgi:hypothetical protein